MKENENIVKASEIADAKIRSDLVADVKTIVENGLRKAYQEVNATLVQTYWQVGRRIVEEEQHGVSRAEYGKGIINFLSKELSAIYSKG